MKLLVFISTAVLVTNAAVLYYKPNQNGQYAPISMLAIKQEGLPFTQDSAVQGPQVKRHDSKSVPPAEPAPAPLDANDITRIITDVAVPLKYSLIAALKGVQRSLGYVSPKSVSNVLQLPMGLLKDYLKGVFVDESKPPASAPSSKPQSANPGVPPASMMPMGSPYH